MKINSPGNFPIFPQKVQGDANVQKPQVSETTARAEVKDVVEFSRGSTAIADKGLNTMKANMQRELSQPAPAEKIEALRESVKNGTYRIPTEAIVDSILGD